MQAHACDITRGCSAAARPLRVAGVRGDTVLMRGCRRRRNPPVNYDGIPGMPWKCSTVTKMVSLHVPILLSGSYVDRHGLISISVPRWLCVSRSRHGRGLPTGTKRRLFTYILQPRRVQIKSYDLIHCFKHEFNQQHSHVVSFTHVAYRGVGRADARRARAPSSLGGYCLIEAVVDAFQNLATSLSIP